MGDPEPSDATQAEFHEAIRQDDFARVKRLVKGDPSLPNARGAAGLSAVLGAAYGRNEKMARWLADRTASLTIFEAAALGDEPLVDRLLSANAALATAYAPDGWTPLHLAAHFGRLAVVERLVAAGARVDAVSKNPVANDPLQAAVANDATEVAVWLLEHGAKPNTRSHGGSTALHLAAQNGNLQIAKALLKHGADIDAEMEGGKRPLTVAEESGNPQVVELLLRHGQKESPESRREPPATPRSGTD